MKVRTKIGLSVSSLAAVITACAGLLLWNTDRTAYNHKRTSLAYEELGGYLRLSGEVFRTFKQVRRDLIDGENGLAFDLDAAENRVANILTEIGIHETAEVAIGAREGEKLDDLSRVRALRETLAAVFEDVRQSERLMATGNSEAGRALLSQTLEARVDGSANTIIEAALADERMELAEALREVEYVNQIAVWAAIAATMIGFLLTALVILILMFRLRDSLANLQAGAEVFASGQLDHEIPASGRDEFAMLANRFNDMARQIRQKQGALEEARAMLERRVIERTEELCAANYELKQHDESRRQFFADIGHELRTPITVVRGEADVALRTRTNHEETYRFALDRIIAISDELARFVDDIFLMAREQAGVLDLRNDLVDLKKAIGAGIEQMETFVNAEGAILTIDFDSGDAIIEGDCQRLSQLVRILVSNAIQHSPTGVHVEIALRRGADDWKLEVSDNGPGIASRNVDKVFDRFFRGGGKRDGIYGNTGLGLPIAKSLVQAHGGKIWIDPDRSEGTAVVSLFGCAANEAKPVQSGEVRSCNC